MEGCYRPEMQFLTKTDGKVLMLLNNFLKYLLKFKMNFSLRSLTLTPGKRRPSAVAAAPKLPDVRACCITAGMNHYGCVDKLCDPTKTFEIGVR